MASSFDDYGSPIYGNWVRPSRSRRQVWISNPYSVVRPCRMCGRIGGLRHVQDRNNAYAPDLLADFYPVLCMACWNKFRVLVYEMDRVKECWKLLNQLDKVRRERKREQNILRAA